MPRVSIVIPAYNAGPYLAQNLQRFQDQTYEDIEVVVVDDGSTDDTLAIAQSFAQADPRFWAYTQDNRNAGIARNNGLQHVTGDYLLFFDADDLADQRMVELLLQRAQQTDADITVCKARCFQDETGQLTDEDFGPNFVDLDKVYSGVELGDHAFNACVGWSWDKLFRADFVQRHGLRFQDLRSTNDALFVYSGMCLADRIAFLDEPLAFHRRHEGSLESSRSKSPHNAAIAANAIVERLQDEPCWPAVKRACLNWSCEHLAWNARTLQGQPHEEASRDCLDMMLRVAHDPDYRSDYIWEDRTRKMVESLIAHEQNPETTVMDLASQWMEKHWEANFYRDELDRRVSTLNAELDLSCAEIVKRDERIAQLEQQLQWERQRYDELENSTMLKVGRAATALPRMLKDAVTGQGRDDRPDLNIYR